MFSLSVCFPKKGHDVPWNGETTWIKSYILGCSHDWVYWISVCLSGRKGKQQNWWDEKKMELFWTLYQMDEVSKHMFKGLIVNYCSFEICKIIEPMEIYETIYEDVVEPYYKKIL